MHSARFILVARLRRVTLCSSLLATASLVSACKADLPAIAAAVGYRPSRVLADGRQSAWSERSLTHSVAAEARVYSPDHDRLFVGFEESLGWEAGTTCCDQWRTGVTAGYTLFPIRGRGKKLGAELIIAAGVGKVPVDEQIPTAFTTGMRLGFPIKMPFFTDECAAHNVLSYSFLLVPEVGDTALFPVQYGNRAVQNELMATLWLRFDVMAFP